MHGQQFLVRSLSFGSDRKKLFLRLDLRQDFAGALAGTELRTRFDSGGRQCEFTILLASEGAELISSDCSGSPVAAPCETGYRNIFEFALDLEAVQIAASAALRFQLSLWRDGLPADAVPQQGWIEFVPADTAD